jgi:hypothetical protein
MADKFRPMVSTQEGRTRVTGYRGARAGESFGTGAEAAQQKQDEDEWAEFARSIGASPQMFSGLGGGAARSKHRAQFDSWRSGKRSGGGATIGALINAGR